MQLTWLHVHSKTYYTDSNKEASKQFFICSTLIWPVIMTKVIPQCTLCLNSCQQQHGFKSQIKSHQIAKSLIKKYFSNCQACTMTKTSIFNVTKSCQNSTSYSHLFSYRQTQWASPGASRLQSVKWASPGASGLQSVKSNSNKTVTWWNAVSVATVYLWTWKSSGNDQHIRQTAMFSHSQDRRLQWLITASLLSDVTWLTPLTSVLAHHCLSRPTSCCHSVADPMPTTT